jgi:uncharacterized membrane protein YdjX (TVP38/TMEM64 family)
MKRPGRRWIVAGIGALVAAAALVALGAGHAAGWADHLEDSLEQRGLLQGVLVFSAATVVGTLLMVPAWIFPVAAGAAFGFGWGLAAAVAAQALAAQCAFLVTRHVLRARIERAAKRNKSFKAVDQAVRKDPWKVVALLRLAPVLPSGLKSYFLGLTAVGPVDYATASAVGTLPGVALKVYVGSAGRDALASGGVLQWSVLAVGAAATIAIGIFVGRFARRRLGF